MRTHTLLTAIALLILMASDSLPAKQPSYPLGATPGNSRQTASVVEKIPTVGFCEMVNNPRLYFDKAVRFTATLQLATEASYLNDDRCVLSHDDQIGVRYVSKDEKQRDLLNTRIRKVRTMDYGGRARVTVVGFLRNSSRRSFAWYRYRFDVTEVEEMSPVIVPYEGTLQGGSTYRAAVRGDNNMDLSLVVPLRRYEHVAVRLEWTNLSDFPTLKRLRTSSAQQSVVFTVISDQTKQMTERRWNLTVECKLISVD